MIGYKIYYVSRLCLSVRSIAHNVGRIGEATKIEIQTFKIITNAK